MSPRVTRSLPAPLLRLLSEGCPALLLTPGEDGYPGSAFTWAAALGPARLHFGADHGSASLGNLERTRRASLQVIGPENLLYLVKGTVTQVRPRLQAAPFKIAVMGLDVVEVRDQAWPGVTVRPLGYDWAPEHRQEMLEMERAVYAELRRGTA